MRDLITEKEKHLLYKDELGDEFLLLKFGEVYEFDKTRLRYLTFSRHSYKKALEIGAVLIDRYDDGLFLLEIETRRLKDLLALGAMKRRMPRNSKRWGWLEEKLAHEIIKITPQKFKKGA